MASFAEIAALMSQGLAGPQGGEDFSIHSGVIQSWDEVSGVNTVLVNGTVLSNLKVIQSGIGLTYFPGDVVTIMRKQSVYFILGRVAAPGTGAGNQIAAAQVQPLESTTSGTFTNLATYGPEVSVTIGSSRRALVFVSATVQISSSSGFMSFQVSGASNIAPDNYRSAGHGSNAAGTIFSAASSSVLLTAAEGLNAGVNVFTAKYRRDVFGAGTGADFAGRRIIVIPF
ncbi:hypothetical protein ACIA2T_19655 [Amycolatopsis japonica]|uniref:hypothetical protein n=1 Tax=Amycolatopsis japonica TaxID=208439 RepID=UPI0037BA398A